MDPTLKALFFGLAIILWVLDQFIEHPRCNFVSLGLASFAFPFFWDALEAA